MRAQRTNNQFGNDNMATRARAAGISPNTVRARVNKGMSLEQALRTPILRKAKVATFDLCLKHRIDQNTLQYRLGKGMSLEEALATPVNSNLSRKVSRARVIEEEWGKPAKEVVRELLRENHSQRSIAEIIGACVNWTRTIIAELKQEAAELQQNTAGDAA